MNSLLGTQGHRDSSVLGEPTSLFFIPPSLLHSRHVKLRRRISEDVCVLRTESYHSLRSAPLILISTIVAEAQQRSPVPYLPEVAEFSVCGFKASVLSTALCLYHASLKSHLSQVLRLAKNGYKNSGTKLMSQSSGYYQILFSPFSPLLSPQTGFIR